MSTLSDFMFDAIADTYNAAEMTLKTAVAGRFPSRSVVDVRHARYNGQAIVRVEDGTPPNELSVELENGNIWRYPVKACRPIPERSAWAPWIQRRLTIQKRRATLFEKKCAAARAANVPL